VNVQHLLDNHHRLSGLYLLTTIFPTGYSQNVTVTNPEGITSTVTIGAAPTSAYVTQTEDWSNLTISEFWSQMQAGTGSGPVFAPVTTDGSNGFWNSTNQPTYLWTHNLGIAQDPILNPPPMIPNLTDDTLRDIAAQVTFPRDYGFTLVGYQTRDDAMSNDIQNDDGPGKVLYYQEFWWADYFRPLVYLIPDATAGQPQSTAGMDPNALYQFTNYSQLIAFAADFLSHSPNAVDLPGYYNTGVASVDFPAFRTNSTVIITANPSLVVSGNVTVDNSSALIVKGSLSATNIQVGPLSVGGAGTGTLTINETGTVTVGGTLSRGANSTINLNASGTLNIGNGGAGGVLATDLVNNGTLAFNSSADSTWSNAVSGTGDVRKLGSGTLTVSGTNTYLGITTISAGTLNVNGSLGSGNVIVNGGTISGAGGTIGNLTVSAGTVALGGTLNTGAVTLNTAARYNVAVLNMTAASNLKTPSTITLGNAVLALTSVSNGLTVW